MGTEAGSKQKTSQVAGTNEAVLLVSLGHKLGERSLLEKGGHGMVCTVLVSSRGEIMNTDLGRGPRDTSTFCSIIPYPILCVIPVLLVSLQQVHVDKGPSGPCEGKWGGTGLRLPLGY